MANTGEASLPDDFFLREQISMNDIRRVVPNGFYQSHNTALKHFSLICQRMKKSIPANWKVLDISSKNDDERFSKTKAELRPDDKLAVTNMIDCGLLANVQELVLDDVDMKIWSNPGLPSSVRRLEVLFTKYGLKHEAEATSEYLRSDRANCLETLSISGDASVLEMIMESLAYGKVPRLQNLYLCSTSFSTIKKVSNMVSESQLTMSLTKSLEKGGICTLLTLKLRGDEFRRNTWSILAQCRQLKMLKSLDLSGLIFEDHEGYDYDEVYEEDNVSGFNDDIWPPAYLPGSKHQMGIGGAEPEVGITATMETEGENSGSKSYAFSSLQHMKLWIMDSNEGRKLAKKLADYLCSHSANKLESLSIQGSFFALMDIITSLGGGQVSSLRVLCLGCDGYYRHRSKVPVATNLVESLKQGGINELRVLNLTGEGWRRKQIRFSTFALSPQLKMLEFLKLSACDVEDDSKLLDLSLHVNHVQNLRTLEVHFLAPSAVEYIIRWLESGKAYTLTEIIYSLYTNYELYPESVRSGHLLRIAEALKMAKLQSLQNFFLFGDVKYLSEGYNVSREVESAFLNAYEQNKFLTARLFIDHPSESRFIKSLRRYEQRNKEYVALKKALGNEPNVPATYGKVFLCGSSRVGKTTLRRTLTRRTNFLRLKKFWKSKEEAPTRGIEVDHLPIAAKGSYKRELELAVWDLAGQFEYEVLHSAFLPDLGLADGKATFFLLVCSANADLNSNFQTAREALLYWLKFIASNSSSKLELRRRRVALVLNCFYDQRSGHELKEWRTILQDCQKTFQDFLNLHPEPFIVNAQKERQISSLKEHIQNLTRESLLDMEVPKICADILQTCRTWAASHGEYPVLPWEEYHTLFPKAAWSFEKFKAATTYLHEAGHLILFKKLRKSQRSQPEDQFVNEAVLVLDPEWLCKRVIGDLLLPEFLLSRGETSLASSYMQENGSLRLALVARDRFQIPQENCEELVQILERLGLGYTLPGNFRDIFIPALIKDDDLPQWFVESSQHWACEEVSSWIMGFSLAAKDSRVTLLPIAIFRNLEVCLALDKDKGRQPDCHFKAGISRISFKWQQMGILVEYYHNTDNAHHNRLDILVKHLVPNLSGTDARLRRRKQVELAQEIVHETLSIASNCCPGLELEVAIVKPWMCAGPFVPLKERDVDFSVRKMMARMQKEIDSAITNEKEEVALATTWDVDGVLVEYQDVLGEEDLKQVVCAFQEKSMYTKSALKSLGLMPANEFCGVEGSPQVQPSGDSAAEGSRDEELIQQLRLEMHQRFDMIEGHIRGMTQELRKAVKLQIVLNRYVQTLVTFTVEERLTSVPRFLYLTEHQKAKSAWVRIKDVFSQEVFLHFLCEARHGDSKMHEVECQLGVSIRYTKEWAEKLGPILDWTFRIAVVAAKVASTVVLPGLDLVANFTSKAIVDVGLITGGVGDLLNFASKSCFDSIQNDPEFSLANNTEQQRARREALLFVKKEIVEKLSDKDFEEKVGLMRVKISDTNGHTQRVAWICRACREKYGSLAEDMI